MSRKRPSTSETVVVVAAHPVQAIIMAEGATSRGAAGAATKRLQAAARKAAAALGAGVPIFFGYPDNRMDELVLLDVIQRLEAELARLKPSIVYTHHGSDLNVDHRITHQAVLAACRPLPGTSIRAVYAFETLSSTEWASPDAEPFRPQHYVNIAAHEAAKLKALDAYAEEMRPFPHPRSKEAAVALAKVRGSAAGLMRAEAFEVIWERVA
jgi:LmbE family N-acetylglucosaminyl deacetylase